MTEQNSYQKSVAQLIASLNSIRQGPRKSFRELSAHSQVPVTTSNRLSNELAAAGWITRDSSPTLLIGDALLKIALNAWGLGHLHSICEPILQQLRYDTRCTAFLGILNHGTMLVGPFSLGNHSDFFIPVLCQPYHYEVTGELSDALQAQLMTPASLKPEPVNGFHLCFQVLANRPLYAVIVGVFYKSIRQTSDLATHINTACERFNSCKKPPS